MASAKWAAHNGSWYVGTNWLPGAVPGGAASPDDVATIDAAGYYTVSVGNTAATTIGSVNLNAPGATLEVSNLGLTVKTALALNSGKLLLRGALRGGSLVMNGGVVTRSNAATLDGVRVQGTLDLASTSSYGQLTLLNNTSFVASDGTSPGAVRVGGTALTFGDSSQFDNASINFVAGYYTDGSLNVGDIRNTTSKVVTFGKNATLNVASNVSARLGGKGTLVNGGAINVAGTLTVSALLNLTQASQPGTLTVQSGGTLIFATPTVYGGTVAFKDATAKLVFQGSGVVGATMKDFQNGDTIDLQGLSYNASLSVRVQGGAVQVKQGSVLVGNFQLTGGSTAYTTGQFSLAADKSSGTMLRITQGLNADFDAAYYLVKNPDVAAVGIDPLQHYLQYGWKEGRDPNAYFSTSYYLNQNPDVRAARLNPLLHFETYGWHEGRDPGPNFSLGKYLAAYPDVKAAGIDPLQQFLANGLAAGRSASPATPHAVGAQDVLVDRTWYLAQHPDVAASGEDASANYHRVGWKLGYNPDQLFDTTYYLKMNPDVAAAKVDPLTHFETYGYHEGREPSLAFSDKQYLAHNADVAAAGVDPLVHYMNYGRAEGRMAFINGPQATGTPDALVDHTTYFAQFATIVPAGVDATASYDQTRWRHGLNPDAYFDTNYYLSHNPDVRTVGMNPLQHYEIYGWKEGRNPSAAFSTAKYLAAYSDVRTSGTDPLTSFITTGQAQGRTAFAV